ncbi:MAG TPA: hypothetical protein VFN75_01800 [Pseudonocardiaceae bacterium]|nr:hypothetical protein [Pseudonocardiaceae bacterium]
MGIAQHRRRVRSLMRNRILVRSRTLVRRAAGTEECGENRKDYPASKLHTRIVT